jgi:uncharacterized membrane protein
LDYAPLAISDDGATCVGITLNGPPDQAIRWTLADGAQDLGYLDSSGGTPTADAFDISGDGTVVVGNTNDGGFVWREEEGMHILSQSPPFHLGLVNHDGSVMIGGTQTDVARWTVEDGVVPLWPGSDYRIVAMNDSETMLVVNPSAPFAERWTAQTGFVPMMPSGGHSSFTAVAASSDLTTVVGSVDGVYGWIWQEHGYNVDLNELLPSLGVDLSDWDFLAGATGVSNDGTVVVGRGVRAGTFEVHGWIAHLGPSCGTADYNHDGDTGTDQDIIDFFNCLAGNCCPTCYTNDFNGDGDAGTDADIEAFFRVLAGQPC